MVGVSRGWSETVCVPRHSTHRRAYGEEGEGAANQDLFIRMNRLGVKTVSSVCILNQAKAVPYVDHGTFNCYSHCKASGSHNRRLMLFSAKANRRLCLLESHYLPTEHIMGQERQRAAG